MLDLVRNGSAHDLAWTEYQLFSLTPDFTLKAHSYRTVLTQLRVLGLGLPM